VHDEVVEQYPGGDEQRAADIEGGAHRPVTELLVDVDASQQALVDAWSQMPDGAWDRMTHARAGDRPVRDGVLSRWREILVHLVDLDVGFEPAQLPVEYVVRDREWLAARRGTWADLPR
jgi:maleylpyruvate isomerase